ncbi:hypothetical protein C8R46DRAFT_1214360 [Mycena filopes]|nr:hypothetical protein C8R46DRAFT_1214360 [Mycena filopes]
MQTRYLCASAFFLSILRALATKQQYFAGVPDDPISQAIVSRALTDGIDLGAFAFSRPALEEIVYWHHFETASSGLLDSLVHAAEGVAAIDVHVNWRKYFSVPNPNLYPGDKGATLAIARLLNENMAALSKAFPDRFGFFGTIPLPHVDASITEADYALGSLGALGVALSSNHEGYYLGDGLFTRFFAALNDHQGLVVIHPTEPLLKVNETLIKANPTAHSPVLAEFYFETARTMLDLALSQTLTNYTRLNFILPHRE